MYEVGMSSTREDETAIPADDASLLAVQAPYTQSVAIDPTRHGYADRVIDLAPIAVRVVAGMMVAGFVFGIAKFFTEIEQANTVAEVELQQDWEQTRISKKVNDAFLVPVKREFAPSPVVDPMYTASVPRSEKNETPVSIGEIAASSEIGFYTVQPGDTLSAIALRNGIPAAALIRRNGIKDPKRLRPGMQLVLAP